MTMPIPASEPSRPPISTFADASQLVSRAAIQKSGTSFTPEKIDQMFARRRSRMQEAQETIQNSTVDLAGERPRISLAEDSALSTDVSFYDGRLPIASGMGGRAAEAYIDELSVQLGYDLTAEPTADRTDIYRQIMPGDNISHPTGEATTTISSVLPHSPTIVDRAGNTWMLARSIMKFPASEGKPDQIGLSAIRISKKQ